LIDIYFITSPVSKYLQIESINYLQAWTVINTLKNQIKKLRNEDHILFVFKKCQKFANNVNSYFHNEPFIEIDEDFPDKQVSNKKNAV